MEQRSLHSWVLFLTLIFQPGIAHAVAPRVKVLATTGPASEREGAL